MKIFRTKKKDFKEKRVKNLVVLDIGTQFLKTLFLEVDKEKERGVLRGWNREKIVNDLQKLYPVCRKAVDKVEKITGLKAEEIFLGVNSKFVKGVSTTFCYKRERPEQKIDSPELKNLFQKVQWRAFDKIRKRFALEMELLETEVRLINASIINIKVDGGSIDNPLGFQGKEICLTIFNTYSSARHLKNLLELATHLGLELIGINSPAYALFRCLNSEEDFLIIDVGGRITEVSLIGKRGEILEIENFHLGSYSFDKFLSDFLDSGIDEAELVKIKYSKKELGLKARKKIEKLFGNNVSSWLAGVRVVLDDFSKNYKLLPSKTFICGGGSNLPGLKEGLEERWKLKTELISPREFSKIENKTKFQEIPSLALANLALGKPEAGEFASALKRAVRLIQGE